ncbi:MAG: hypothetical protein EAX90_08555 [Candidatus Heimdallarchaeota archaeon]|nr:hypothetical protein [Candidatus Heimdallarchaeota archaeon]
MRATLKRASRISILAFTIIVMTSLITVSSVIGGLIMDRPKTIQPGISNVFIYSIDNFKNRRYTVTVELDITVPEGFVLDSLVIFRDEWERIRENDSIGLSDINQLLVLANETVEKGTSGSILEPEPDILEYEVIIPDNDDWTFVFLNLNAADMLCHIRITNQHILWWLWVVIPSIVVIGLVSYGVTENVTRYQRARMESSKALSKLGDKSEGERKRSVYWLISNGTEEDLVALAEQLNSSNSIIRGNAAWAIGGLARRLNDKKFGTIITQKFNEENDPITKEEMVAALCDIGHKPALPIFEKYLLSERNEILRFRIAEALEEMVIPESASCLVKIINGENTETLKLATKRALEKIADDQGTKVEDLIKKYSN